MAIYYTVFRYERTTPHGTWTEGGAIAIEADSMSKACAKLENHSDYPKAEIIKCDLDEAGEFTDDQGLL
jgi:hypothetical protein